MTTKRAKKGAGWQSRIVDQGEVDPAELEAKERLARLERA